MIETLFLSDVDECFQAALDNTELCKQNSVCLNTEGTYECPCISGFKHINETCQSEYIKVLKLLANIEMAPMYLIILGEAETPPPVQQITPPDAEENRLKVLITGLVPSTVRECDYSQACHNCL